MQRKSNHGDTENTEKKENYKKEKNTQHSVNPCALRALVVKPTQTHLHVLRIK
jgi:hypothetical protein